MAHGFIYLMAIMDWFSQYMLSWAVSITLEVAFCIEALEKSLLIRTPEIFNSDQGVKYTSEAFTGRLQRADIRISMDGRGQAFDNIFIERLWRTVKYEEVYIKDYQTVGETVSGLSDYFEFYNNERSYQPLNKRTPAEVYFGR